MVSRILRYQGQAAFEEQVTCFNRKFFVKLISCRLYVYTHIFVLHGVIL